MFKKKWFVYSFIFLFLFSAAYVFENEASAAAKTYKLTVKIKGAGRSGVAVNVAGNTVDKTLTTKASGVLNFLKLPKGTYTITPTKTGYSFTPPTIDVTLSKKKAVVKNFTIAAIPQIGTVNVTTNLSSSAFIVYGPGGASYPGSGTSLAKADAPAGSYTVVYGAVSGYTTPASETQTVSVGGTINFTGTYELQAVEVGTVDVTTNLSSATFTVYGPGGASYPGSGTSFSTADALAGSYTIIYGAVSGYTTPDSETQTLSAGGTLSLTGTYAEIVVPATVTEASISVSNPANGTNFAVGESPVVTVTLPTDSSRSDYSTLGLYLFGPQETTKTLTAVKLLNASTDRTASTHHYINLLTNADVQVNDNVLTYILQPITDEEAGTYTASMRTVLKADESVQSMPLVDLQIGTATAETQIVEKEKCGACHLGADNGQYYFHHVDPGRSPTGSPSLDSVPVGTCKACHNTNGYAAYTDPGTGDKVADNTVKRVHGVHLGEERLPISNVTGTFKAGETITGIGRASASIAASNATAQLVKVASKYFVLGPITGTFTSGEEVSNVGGSIARISTLRKGLKSYEDINNWLLITGATGTFSVGDTVTGSISGATTAIVNVASDNSYLIVGDITGTLIKNEILTNGTATATFSSERNGLFVDYKQVTFPAEIETCTACHTDDRWKTNLSREACGSCHDNVWFGDSGSIPLGYQEHSGGAQEDDASCTVCHASGDASVETVHAITPVTFEHTLAIDVSTPANGACFVAGEQPVVTMTLNDATTGALIDGTTITEAAWNAFQFYVAGPRTYSIPKLTSAAGTTTTSSSRVNDLRERTSSANNDPKSARTSAGITYTLSDVSGLDDGTYTIFVRERKASSASRTIAVSKFQVGTSTEDAKVATNCADCHGDAKMHTSYPFDTDICINCHDYERQLTGKTQWSESQWGFGYPPLSRLIHGWHFAAYLNSPTTIHSGLTTDVIFPQDVRNCTKCHAESTKWKEEPNRLACLSCHDSDEAVSHGNMMTYDPTPTDPWSGDEAETCKVCHGSGTEFSPDTVHNISDPYKPPYTREPIAH